MMEKIGEGLIGRGKGGFMKGVVIKGGWFAEWMVIEGLMGRW